MDRNRNMYRDGIEHEIENGILKGIRIGIV